MVANFTLFIYLRLSSPLCDLFDLGLLIFSSHLFLFPQQSLPAPKSHLLCRLLVIVMLNYNGIYRNLLAKAIFLSADKWICQALRNNSVRLSSCSVREKKP